MAAKMICKINIGAMYQTIYIENEKYGDKKTVETHKILLRDFPEFVVNQLDVPDVYVSGITEDFFKKIEQETKLLEKTKYNKNTKHFHYV